MNTLKNRFAQAPEGTAVLFFIDSLAPAHSPFRLSSTRRLPTAPCSNIFDARLRRLFGIGVLKEF